MKYIIVAFQIINMGGEQQYCRNKLNVMEKLGYDVALFSADKGNVFIEELKKYVPNTIGELKYPVFCFTPNHVRKVINKMAMMIGECSEDSVIESVNVATSEWAELLAAKLKIKHVCFALDEAFTISKTESIFLKFKHERRELAGIAIQSLKLMFKGYYDIPDEESYFIDASCSNVVSDYDYAPKGLSLTDESIFIGSIGRLEKGFVLPSLVHIREYIINHPESRFTIVMIGGTTEMKVERKIRKLLRNIPNVKLFITGFIYPIPRSLIRRLNVCFSTAGSALITGVDEFVPTISVDTFTGQPVGILNYTTTENMYADCCSNVTFAQLLDDILFNNYCDSHETLGMLVSNSDETFYKEVLRELEFTFTCHELQYYDVLLLRPDCIKYKLYAFIGRAFGLHCLEFVHLKILHIIKITFAALTKTRKGAHK